MRSNVSDVLPPAVKRSLTKFGGDLATARRKRGLTVLAVAERMGVAKNTYLRAEKGDPKVGLGVYAMALFVLGFGDPLGALIDVSRDDTGLLLDEQRLPKRVRMKKAPRGSRANHSVFSALSVFLVQRPADKATGLRARNSPNFMLPLHILS